MMLFARKAANLTAAEDRQMRAMPESDDPEEIARIFRGYYD